MSSSRKEHDKRRGKVLEALTELFLRLNGYFCVPNYLQHRVQGFGLGTESDVLALRLPHQEEILPNGRRQPNDEGIVLREGAVIDCVIAEVKEPSVEFNKSLRGASGPQRIYAALKMFGAFPAQTFEAGGAAEKIVNELHAKINTDAWPDFPSGYCPEHDISVRLIVFAPDVAKHARYRNHIDLQHALRFVRRRMRPGEPCAPYRSPQVPSASPWRGCTRLIVETMDEHVSSSDADFTVEQLIAGAIARWGVRNL